MKLKITMLLFIISVISAVAQDSLVAKSKPHAYFYSSKTEIRPTGSEKSQVVASALSLIVPGAGQVYVGDFKTGIVHCVVNMSLGYLMLESNYSDSRKATTFFYFGRLIWNAISIVNASEQANRVNVARGYVASNRMKIRVEPFVERNQSVLAATGSSPNNVGLSLSIHY